jgi:hypothetical protein
MRIGARLPAACLFALALGFTNWVHAQNLVPDPSFAHGVDAWTPLSVTGNFTMTFAPDVSKRPGSGSALLSFTGPASGQFAVCLSVSEGLSYDRGYSILFPDASRIAGLNEFFDIHAGPGCSGAVLGGTALVIVPGQLNAWLSPTSRLVMPPGATSIRLGFGALGVGDAQPLAYLDDVFFGITGTVPPIDPPTAVPLLSRASAAALGLGLAAAALRSLKT